ncbi:MAG: aminoglycoside phosphotransferase family protein [Rhizomicrobium sp.]
MTFDDDAARVRLHADEVFATADQVRRLLAAQFPHWAALPIRPVRSHGTDNAIWRLGETLALRMPRHAGAAAHIDKDWRWLPHLAPRLPVPIPVPLAKGGPGEGYPWPWSVCAWLAGENPDPDRLADPQGLARDLAGFLLALRAIDARGAPRPGVRNFGRGVPLAVRDAPTRDAIAALHGTIDTEAVTAAWKRAREAPVWSGPPLWIHGDLNAGNILLRDGRLGGVIDFGSLAAGDPACDLLAAWYVFGRDGRKAFREALAADDASWARARGWALSMALIALPYYKETSPAIVAESLRVIGEILSEA